MSKFKVGDTFYLQKGLPMDPLYKCHVIGIVEEYMVVYKWYGKRRQWWHYQIEEENHLQNLIEIYKEKQNVKNPFY
jgi:hypothetical protein